MMNEQVQGFKYYATAIVMTDLLEGAESNQIEVLAIEHNALVDGVQTSARNIRVVEGVDGEGKTYSVTLTTSNTIPAIWLPMGTNRITAPNVRRGEEVWLWRYGNSSQLYWTTPGLHDERRLTETIIYGIAARPDVSEDLDPSKNMYTIEMSSGGKHITLKTTTALGEPFPITLQVNAGSGVVTLTNEAGVDVEVDFVNDLIRAINASKTEVRMDGPKLETHAEMHTIMRAPKMQFGEDDAVQKSVLGDTHAAGHEELEKLINESQVIGNLGIPTSTIQAVRKIDISSLKPNGSSYSKVNTNQ
jgi:hypothetical protein